MDYKLNKDTLKKLLYNDHADEKQRVFLNINLLRHFKNYLLDSMTEKERGCINLYHLENYLIERALDPMTEDIYKECDDLVQYTLNYLRSRPDYWIINSEIYLNIISQSEDNFYLDDKYENKNLTAIYNYIYNNELVKPIEKYKNQREESIINNYLNSENIEDLINDPDYCNFVKLLERESCLEIDETFKTIYDVTLIPLIYKFAIEKYATLIKNYSCLNQDGYLEIKLQNFILFFSYVHYEKDLDCLWNNKSKSRAKNNLMNGSTKKYSLRINKINEEELDQMFIKNQIKLLNLQDQINQLKNKVKVREFFSYLKKQKVNIIINLFTKIIQEIFKGENSHKDKNEMKFNIIIKAYEILNNMLAILEEYLNFKLKNKTENCDDNMINLKNLFETHKTLNKLYKEELKESEINSFIYFYDVVVEKNNKFKGCINVLKRFIEFNQEKLKRESLKEIQDSLKFENCFGSNLSEKTLEQVSDNYLNEYFDLDDTKLKRIYKMEHAGVNWTEDDIKKFKEGLELYGQCQLANIKIAKYMGSHIEASHVKLFRSRISKEKRIKRKYEKEIKISEMKKKRHLKWKEVEGDHMLLD